jgi:hypothetical protein
MALVSVSTLRGIMSVDSSEESLTLSTELAAEACNAAKANAGNNILRANFIV